MNEHLTIDEKLGVIGGLIASSTTALADLIFCMHDLQDERRKKEAKEGIDRVCKFINDLNDCWVSDDDEGES